MRYSGSIAFSASSSGAWSARSGAWSREISTEQAGGGVHVAHWDMGRWNVNPPWDYVPGTGLSCGLWGRHGAGCGSAIDNGQSHIHGCETCYDVRYTRYTGRNKLSIK